MPTLVVKGGIWHHEAGEPRAQKMEDLSGDAEWTKHRITFAVPADAASTKVVIFLSETGILGVRKVSVTKAKPSDLPESLLANGDFSNWPDGRPNNWTVEIGAKNGADEPKSEVIRVDDSGLSLRGTGSTTAWHSVSQSLSLGEGKADHLEFQSRSNHVRRQGRQHDNCDVGVMIFDANGKRVGTSIKDLSRNSDWRRHRIDFEVPPGADKTEVIIFLSKTGELSVKNLLLSEAGSRGLHGS